MNKRSLEETYQFIALAGVIWLLNDWLTGFARELFENNFLDFEIAAAADDQTMHRMTQLSIGQHNSQHSGLKQNIINRGQHSLTALVNMTIYNIGPTFTQGIIMTCAMFLISIPPASIVLATMTIFVVTTVIMNRRFIPEIMSLERRWNRESQFRGEMLQHMSHIIMNAQEERARQEADDMFQANSAIAKPLWNRFLIYGYLKSMVILYSSHRM